MCSCLYSDVLFSNVLFISDTVYKEIFEDGHVVIIDSNGTMRFRVVKISRLQANPQKQRNYFTSKISQYTVLFIGLGNSLVQVTHLFWMVFLYHVSLYPNFNTRNTLHWQILYLFYN